LAPQRDWRDPDSDELEEEAEEEKPPAPWRHEEAGSYKDTGTTSGAKDWRAGSFEQILAKKIPVDSWEPVEEKPELVETAPTASNIVKETPVAPAVIAKTSPVTGTIAAAPFGMTRGSGKFTCFTGKNSDGHRDGGGRSSASKTERSTSSGARGCQRAGSEASRAINESPKDSWFSVPSNPWNAEIEKANKLASAWDAAAPVALPAGSNGTEKLPRPSAKQLSR